jgi:hypothetical protein
MNWSLSAPLSPADEALIRAVKWRVWTIDQALAIAAGWNGGMTTAEMAADLECRPGSVRLTIGKLTQIGCALRPGPHAIQAAIIQGRAARSPRARLIAAERLRRLERMAPDDLAIKAALAQLPAVST